MYEDGSLSQSYTYEDNGNRLTLDTPSESITATYDDQDRLLTYGPMAYTYTNNGELLSKTDTATNNVTLYEYDVFGNLVRVDLPDGTVIEYLIDGQNRRVGKAINSVLVKQWLWADQLRIAAELDGAGNLVARFVYGDKATTPELVIQNGAVYRVISDHLGSVRALVNINDPQDMPVRLDYEAFGGVSGTGVGFVPQAFAGGLYDDDTGLLRFGARDFDPLTGRWLAKDPIEFVAGPNLYRYISGDPVNTTDPGGQIPNPSCPVVLSFCTGFTIGTQLAKLIDGLVSCQDRIDRAKEEIDRCPVDQSRRADRERAETYWECVTGYLGYNIQDLLSGACLVAIPLTCT